VKTITLKPRTEDIAEAWVDLQNGSGIVGKEEIQPVMYTARSLSENNTDKAMVSILISTEEATEITNFTASARQWSQCTQVRMFCFR
jgi:hypothetical protein